MTCEYCNNEHDGSYASGRFCRLECARAFSTRKNRESINRKVSLKLIRLRNCKKCGKETCGALGGTKAGYCKECRFISTKLWTFEQLKKNDTRKARIIKENGHKCEVCLQSIWNHKKIPLQLDHIDGNSDNHSRSNLRVLCPNCHAQTDTFSWKNVGKFPEAKRAKKRTI